MRETLSRASPPAPREDDRVSTILKALKKAADGRAKETPPGKITIEEAPEPAAPERIPAPPAISTPTPVPAPATPVQPPASERTPVPSAVAPASRVSPKPPSVPPARPSSGRDLEDELKSQFDPTLQELEKGLRRPKSSP